jgi:predicted Zn-dependent protease
LDEALRQKAKERVQQQQQQQKQLQQPQQPQQQAKPIPSSSINNDDNDDDDIAKAAAEAMNSAKTTTAVSCQFMFVVHLSSTTHIFFTNFFVEHSVGCRVGIARRQHINTIDG